MEKHPRFSLVFVLILIVAAVVLRPSQAAEGQIRVLVRADDIGSSHAANEACIKSCREGIARSVEIMVPAGWYPEAVKMLAENPQIDVGVHLVLTSEWENVKWRPMTAAPSLVDALGYFYPMTSQRTDFPPNTGFLQAPFKLEDVEKELRAQIETARKTIKTVTHLSAHMGTSQASAPLRALTAKLADEYQLPVDFPELKWLGVSWKGTDSGEQRALALVAALESVGPGTWLFIEHPGLDTPEMRAIGHHGYWNVAEDRAGVTHAFTSEKVKNVIERRQIQLISYGDVIRER